MDLNEHTPLYSAARQRYLATEKLRKNYDA